MAEGMSMPGDGLLPIRKGLHAVVMVISWISAAALSVMVLVIFVNVLGRYLFGMPLKGSVEVVEATLVVVVFFSLAYTETLHGHVTMDEVVARFPRRARAIVMSIMYFAAAAFFFIMAWRDGVLAVSYMKPIVRVTDVLHIPVGPFIFIIAVGAVIFGLELLMNGLCPVAASSGNHGKVK
jgi:TRAP-type transport system small permease protein